MRTRIERFSALRDRWVTIDPEHLTDEARVGLVEQAKLDVAELAQICAEYVVTLELLTHSSAPPATSRERMILTIVTQTLNS